jgi:hypothetical protein
MDGSLESLAVVLSALWWFADVRELYTGDGWTGRRPIS